MVPFLATNSSRLTIMADSNYIPYLWIFPGPRQQNPSSRSISVLFRLTSDAHRSGIAECNASWEAIAISLLEYASILERSLETDWRLGTEQKVILVILMAEENVFLRPDIILELWFYIMQFRPLAKYTSSTYPYSTAPTCTYTGKHGLHYALLKTPASCPALFNAQRPCFTSQFSS